MLKDGGDMDTLGIDIRVREQRKKRNLTLAELSKRTGISISFLSQIESGKGVMTLVTLKKIAQALDIPMKELFSESQEDEAVIRFCSDKDITSLQNNYRRLDIRSGKFAGRKMDAFVLTMDPHFSRFEETRHVGEEFYYILHGVCIVHLNGKEYQIGEGESIHFPSTLTHKLENPGEEELTMVSVITPSLF